MKNFQIYLVLALSLLLTPQLWAQQGIGTNLPDKSAALEIVSSQRGLLIPRFGIPDLEAAAPVTNPAHALLVFNDGTEGGTAPGFYWWDENANNGDGAWKAVTGEPGEPGETPEIQITGDAPITVGNLGDNQWSIGLEVGNDGDVLVTDANGDAVWTPIENFINDVNIMGDNGITIIEDPNGDQIVQLGGTLTEDATEIVTSGDVNTLAITGLVDLTQDVEDGILDLADFDVVIMDENGILKRISTTQLMSEADVELNFENGLMQIGDVVKLGGALTEATTLTTDDANTLAIDGLQAVDAAHKIVVVEDDGVLRTVTRSLQANVSGDYDVSGTLGGYSAYVQEINLFVNIGDLTGGDITITLPDATIETNGQVINVKLSEGDEADNYLNIHDIDGLMTWGAMPHQAWIFKSNGINWQIVGKN